MHREISELRNSSEYPQKFLEILGNSWIIFGNSNNLQDKNLTPLAQKKLAGWYTFIGVFLVFTHVTPALATVAICHLCAPRV